MTLIVTRKDYNPLRASKRWPEIKKLAQQRDLKVIGAVYISPVDPDEPTDDGKWECHKCGGKYNRSKVQFGGAPDILGECPGCSYPFLFIKA